MKLIHKIYDATALMVAIAATLACFGLIVWSLSPLSPIITIFFFLLGTFTAFFTRKTAILAVLGIALYGFSWAAAEWWDAWPAALICMAGFTTWFLASWKGFTKLMSR